MQFPNIDNQKFSDKTLRGFLLKNVDSQTDNIHVKTLNKYLINRVDNFWDQVVIPLRKQGKFKPQKIEWYFEVYKEGYEARRVGKNPYPFLNIDGDKVKQIIEFFKDKSLLQYLELGTSYLTNTYSLLSSWTRDQMILTRLEKIYSSEDPCDWIKRAEEEEKGIMSQKLNYIDGLQDILNNIGLIISKRV